MLSPIEGCPKYEDDRPKWEQVVRNHLSDYSKEALIEFAVTARLEVEHLNMHLTFAYKMHAIDIAGLNILRSLARRNPNSMDIEGEIAKIEAEHGSENADFLRAIARAATKKYSKGLTDEGRRRGGTVTKQRSEEHKSHIKKAVEDIFKHKESFDWSDRKIALWLIQKGLSQYEGASLGERQMINYVKEIRQAYKTLIYHPAS